MAGDVRLGAVLAQLRTARGLTMVAVARQTKCSLSLLSYVESGDRVLQPWLAQALDRIYGTGSVVASLARGAASTPKDSSASEVPTTDVFVVQLPQGGAAMLLSRREALTALGAGIVSCGPQEEFERALDRIEFNDEIIRFFEDSFRGFKEAARALPPELLIDGMIGNVAVLDGLRRRVADAYRYRCSVLQAYYAETLSWLSVEAGDLRGAVWWMDRASQWAQAAGWQGMAAWAFVRRSVVVLSFSGDGLRVVDQQCQGDERFRGSGRGFTRWSRCVMPVGVAGGFGGCPGGCDLGYWVRGRRGVAAMRGGSR